MAILNPVQFAEGIKDEELRDHFLELVNIGLAGGSKPMIAHAIKLGISDSDPVRKLVADFLEQYFGEK